MSTQIIAMKGKSITHHQSVGKVVYGAEIAYACIGIRTM